MNEENQNSKQIERLVNKVEALAIHQAETNIIMSEGFKGTHLRQDQTNGRIGKLEDRADLIESVSDENSRRLDTVDGLHRENREIVQEQKKNRKWIKRELATTLLGIIAVILQAVILFYLIGTK